MQLLEIGIQNFKSLKSVTLKPGPLSVFIGPNGAGKSNLCEALDFIGEMYRSALNVAMTTHGGYERLTYAGSNLPTSTLGFRVRASLSKRDLERTWMGEPNTDAPHEIVITHELTIGVGSDRVHDPYQTVEEHVRYDGRLTARSRFEEIIRIDKRGDVVQMAASPYAIQHLRSSRYLSDEDAQNVVTATLKSSEAPLVAWTMEALVLPSVPLRASLGAVSLYKLESDQLRRDGVPTPTPRLGRSGSNLPAVLAWLQSDHPERFQVALDTLRSIMPTLANLEVGNERGLLEMTFHEIGTARPWTANEVSDGTLRTLGLLTAVLDPSSVVTIIEEPENGLHPWAIRQFIEACRLASQSKQIVLTTHSPAVLDQLHPEEIWVVSKQGSETSADRLDDLDPDARIGWDSGEFTLSGYLDSGIVRRAVPLIAP